MSKWTIVMKNHNVNKFTDITPSNKYLSFPPKNFFVYKYAFDNVFIHLPFMHAYFFNFYIKLRM